MSRRDSPFGLPAPLPARRLVRARLELEAAARTSTTLGVVTPELEAAVLELDLARALLSMGSGRDQVAALVGEGLSDVEISEFTGLDVRTVRVYRRVPNVSSRSSDDASS